MVTIDAKKAFAARLNTALDEARLPPKGEGRQRILGKMFGVSQAAGRKWLEGEAIPTHERLATICKQLDVSPDWLLTGRGPKQLGPSHQVNESADNSYASSLTPGERAWLDLYRKLRPAHREILTTIGRALRDAHP